MQAFIEAVVGKSTRTYEVQTTANALDHVRKKRTLTEEDWQNVVALPEEAEGGIQTRDGVNGEKVMLFRRLADEQYVVGIFELSVNEARSKKGKGGTVRFNVVTGYKTTEEGLRETLKRETEYAERNPKSAVDGRRNPSMTPVSGRYYPERKRPRDPGSFSNKIIARAKNRIDSSQEVVEKGSSFSQDRKGDYFPSFRIIARWKGADRSTLLHETGHLFLDMRMRLATDLLAQENLTESQKALVASVQDILKWFGVKDLETWNGMTAKEQEKFHEKFARSFEAYVMEGDAPVKGLRKIFRDFTNWLKDIYSVMANIPGAETSEKVREMFDAFFVSQEQGRESRMRQAVQPAFESAEEAGMNEAEWQKYQEAQKEVSTEAEAELTARNIRLQRAVKNLRNRLLRQFRQERKASYPASFVFR